MTTDPETAHKVKTTQPILPNWLGYMISVSMLLVYMLCLGMMFPFVVGYYLFVGWFHYLQHIMNSQTFALGQVVWVVIVLAGIVTGLHLVLKQSYDWRQRVHALAPEAAPLSPWRKRWTSSVLILLLILGGSGLAAVEISQQVRSMATGDEQLVTRQYTYSSYGCSRTKNHLKQIGLALHNYHEFNDRLPPGGIFDRAGQPQHSWITQILPYTDHASLYHKIDFQQPWTAEANRQPFQTKVNLFEIPNRSSTERNQKQLNGYMPADYAANAHIMNVNSGLNFKEIKDGLSNTLLVGEVNSGVKAWGDPTNFRDPILGVNDDPRGFRGANEGGAHFLLGDGSVRFINENIDPAVLKALATPNGGEDVSDFLEDW